MPLFGSRRPPLPAELEPAWWAFLDCCEVLEGGRRVLVAVLPVGRVEPAPIALGTEALRRAIEDVRAWMPTWRIEGLEDDWDDCDRALDRVLGELRAVDDIAADTDELDDVLDPIRMLMDRLDAFATAERTFRRRWRCPERDAASMRPHDPDEAGGAR
jgi:hypothetical protein